MEFHARSGRPPQIVSPAHGQIYAIRASDPLMLGGAIVLVVAITVLATMIPAWRASRLAPSAVMHAE